MLALPNDRWRAFVVALLDVDATRGRYTEAARRAGFDQNPAALQVTAFRMAHDTRVQEAVQEEARKRLNSNLPLALKAAEDILLDTNHKDRALMVKTVFDRTGLHGITETKHTHEFIGDDAALLQRAVILAERLGIPIAQLIGRSAALKLTGPQVQEAEFVEVKKEEK